MIGTSFSPLSSQGVNAINSSIKDLNKSLTKLASGLRINRASDDAAGLAISSNLLTSANLDSQALRNISDAQSAINITDAAVQQISDMNLRRSELAMQASNGTYSSEQRLAMQQEFSQLGQEMQRVAQTTEFNGVKLLNGESISVQVGPDGSSNSSITVGGLDLTSALSAGNALDLSSQGNALTALGSIKDFTTQLNLQRAQALGSAQSRLNSSASIVSESRLSKIAGYSRINDLDIAQTVANLNGQTIQVKAGIALLAQAKDLNANMLSIVLK